MMTTKSKWCIKQNLIKPNLNKNNNNYIKWRSEKNLFSYLKFKELFPLLYVSLQAFEATDGMSNGS